MDAEQESGGGCTWIKIALRVIFYLNAARNRSESVRVHTLSSADQSSSSQRVCVAPQHSFLSQAWTIVLCICQKRNRGVSNTRPRPGPTLFAYTPLCRVFSKALTGFAQMIGCQTSQLFWRWPLSSAQVCLSLVEMLACNSDSYSSVIK